MVAQWLKGRRFTFRPACSSCWPVLEHEAKALVLLMLWAPLWPWLPLTPGGVQWTDSVFQGVVSSFSVGLYLWGACLHLAREVFSTCVSSLKSNTCRQWSLHPILMLHGLNAFVITHYSSTPGHPRALIMLLLPCDSLVWGGDLRNSRHHIPHSHSHSRQTSSTYARCAFV